MSIERDAWAERLLGLSRDPRFETRREDLESLADAVRESHPGEWTGIDLIEAFPPEASIILKEQTGIERWLGILAGVSVFLPVGWTWLSLHQASKAYRSLLEAGDEQGRTFLAMWTTGFDGRLGGMHTFVPMAVVAFLLVAFAVACIVAHRFVADMNIAREEGQNQSSRRELVAALSKTQRLLNQQRTDEPHFLEAAIKESIERLTIAHQATQDGIEQLNHVVVESIQKVTETVNAAVSEVSNANTSAVLSLSETTGATVRNLGEVSTRMASELVPLVDTVSSASQTVADSAQLSAESQRAFSDASASVNEILQTSMRDFESAVGLHNKMLSEASSQSMGQLTQSVREVARVEEEATGDFREQIAVLQATIVQMAGILERHESALQSQVNDYKNAADLSHQVLKALDELRARTFGSAV